MIGRSRDRGQLASTIRQAQWTFPSYINTADGNNTVFTICSISLSYRAPSTSPQEASHSCWQNVN